MYALPAVGFMIPLSATRRTESSQELHLPIYPMIGLVPNVE